MLPHSAPSVAMLHRVGRDLQSADAEAIEMRLPGGLIGKPCLWLRGQLADHRSGERAAAHVVQRRVVDHVVGVAGAQQVEEVQPALAGPVCRTR